MGLERNEDLARRTERVQGEDAQRRRTIHQHVIVFFQVGIKLVAEDKGWSAVPPGTRKSLYENPEYQKAPFVAATLQAMETADPTNPAITKVPYTGIQFVGIPEFQAIGTQVGQNMSAALSGKMSVDQALKASQVEAERAMKQGGYLK